MAVNGVPSTTTPNSALAGSRATIAENFDTFLNILTTQLKNQNPLDPLDTNQFTQQLVQFTGVEQQLKTNEFLEALLDLSSTSQSTSAQAMSMIGKEVTVSTSAGELKNGAATWVFDASGKSDAAIFTVKDPKGNVVYTSQKPVVAGEGRFVWDGKAADGTQLPDGAYYIGIEGKDTFGKPLSFTTEMAGKVEGVDMSGAQPYLMIGSARISVGSVLSVRNL